MGAGSFGFQFGAEAAEVVLLILSQKGVESLLLGNFKLAPMARSPSGRSEPESPEQRRRI